MRSSSPRGRTRRARRSSWRSARTAVRVGRVREPLPSPHGPPDGQGRLPGFLNHHRGQEGLLDGEGQGREVLRRSQGRTRARPAARAGRSGCNWRRKLRWSSFIGFEQAIEADPRTKGVVAGYLGPTLQLSGEVTRAAVSRAVAHAWSQTLGSVSFDDQTTSAPDSAVAGQHTGEGEMTRATFALRMRFLSTARSPQGRQPGCARLCGVARRMGRNAALWGGRAARRPLTIPVMIPVPVGATPAPARASRTKALLADALAATFNS